LVRAINLKVSEVAVGTMTQEWTIAIQNILNLF